MNEDSSKAIDCAAGATVISEIATVIGSEHGVDVSGRVWDMGEDFGHEYAHRLDLSTATNTVRLYFSDLDLTASGNKARKSRVEDRLRRAIAQLVVRTPSPMYTY